MFSYFTKKKEKKFALENIDIFEVVTDRGIDYDVLTKEVRALESQFAGDPSIKNDPDHAWDPSTPEELNKRLIAATQPYVYYPGDVVHGVVNLTLKDNIPAKSLKAQLLGVLTVKYKHTIGNTTYYETKETLLHSKEVELWRYDGDEKNAVMHGGTYRYDFQFEVPHDVLGSMGYESSGKQGGWVNYVASAVIETIHSGHIDTMTLVSVQRLLFKGDPCVPAEIWNEPSELEKHETFCCSGGYIDAHCSLNPGIYTYDGQDILFDLFVQNYSRKVVHKIRVWLTQHVDFRHKGETKYGNDKEILDVKISTNIRPRNEETLRGVRVPIPVGLEPTLVKHGSQWGELVCVKYTLYIGIFTGKHIPDVMFEYSNFVIGSQPSVVEEQPYGAFGQVGNHEYKKCKIRVRPEQLAISARQTIVGLAEYKVQEEDKEAKKAARAAGNKI